MLEKCFYKARNRLLNIIHLAPITLSLRGNAVTFHMSSRYIWEITIVPKNRNEAKPQSLDLQGFAIKFYFLIVRDTDYARVRDKRNSLCQLLCSTSPRDNHFFTSPILFRGAWFLVPNSPISHSDVRIFIASKMRFLSSDAAWLH